LTGKSRFLIILRKSKENEVLQVVMTNFGASFRQARVSQGISLDQIATETRISTRFLSAIENEEFQLLPGGIFNRGFVRAFAERVGLDPDQAVADYARMAEARQPEPPAPPEPPPLARRQRRLYPIAVGVLALAIVVFYVVTRESGDIAQTASTPATPPVAAPTPARAAPNALSLEIDAQDQSWIRVVADGESANPGELLQAGMTHKYTAQNKLIITVGNAGGLMLKLNDKPMKGIGKSGQVREIVITPETAKNLIAP
jgi:cytoskeletal protein RodZ